ncbi:uncharacterized protein LOC142161740 [Nicotiana tabacum]|uniref:Uncharacterized protein LOC142161740 n=3 Tax=Nicotiana tabacum TaxID=4097 RepID=A0AC58UPA4_TOBAC
MSLSSLLMEPLECGKLKKSEIFPISQSVKVLLKFMFQLFSLLCAKLLCRYEHKSVLRFLETFENYRVERCLHLCREYGIVDTASLLLERVGDIGSALLLAISSLAEKFILLLKVNTVMQLPRISKLFFKQERGH